MGIDLGGVWVIDVEIVDGSYYVLVLVVVPGSRLWLRFDYWFDVVDADTVEFLFECVCSLLAVLLRILLR